MKLVLTTAPDDPTEDHGLMAAVLDHLNRASTPADLDTIRQSVRAAVARIDGPKSGIRRALLTQEWTLYLDHFPPVVEVPLSPIQTVDSVKYLDADGVKQTMDPLLYRLSGAHSWRPEIAPAHNESWPPTLAVGDSIEIAFTAGYGDDASDIPPAILQAVMELAAHLYRERQPVAFGQPYELPFGVKHLLSPFKVWR